MGLKKIKQIGVKLPYELWLLLDSETDKINISISNLIKIQLDTWLRDRGVSYDNIGKEDNYGN